MKKKLPVPLFAIASLSLGFIALILNFIFRKSEAFSDFWNETIGFGIRFILAKITGIFPFSFGEFLLFSSPVLLFIVALIVYRCVRKSQRELISCISCLLSIAAIVYSLFVLDFSAGYHGTPLSKKLGYSESEITADNLYSTCEIISNKLHTLSVNIESDEGKSSQMPYTLWELSEKLCAGYDTVCRKHDFIDDYSSKVKPLVISKYMTYTHISGIYTFFTGEANLNTNFPDYVKVYTAAHEMAHQRGISREDEANFIAFLVCSSTKDSYIEYCAYLNLFEYVANALYSTDPELYYKAYSSLPQISKVEMKAYSDFFEKYKDNTAADVTDVMNDSYLKGQGTQGVVSYGMVARLAVYHFSN